jgi:hypothetical protein
MGNCLQEARWAHLSPKARDSLVQRKKMDLVPRIRQQRRVAAKKRSQEAALQAQARKKLAALMDTAYVTEQALTLQAEICCNHGARKHEYDRLHARLQSMEAGVDQWAVNTDMGTVMLKVLAETEQGLASPEASQRLPDMITRLERAMQTGGTVPGVDAGTGAAVPAPADRRPRGTGRPHDRHTVLVEIPEDGDEEPDGVQLGATKPTPEVQELLQQVHSEVFPAQTPFVAVFPTAPSNRK